MTVISMTEKEFVYAAMCNFGAKGKAKALEYISENKKDAYSADDWIAVFHSDPEPIKTGANRHGMSRICERNNSGWTTRQWT